MSSPNYVYMGCNACVCSAGGVLKRALDALEIGIMDSCELPDTGSGKQTPGASAREAHLSLQPGAILLICILVICMMKLVFISRFQSWLHIANF